MSNSSWTRRRWAANGDPRNPGRPFCAPGTKLRPSLLAVMLFLFSGLPHGEARAQAGQPTSDLDQTLNKVFDSTNIALRVNAVATGGGSGSSASFLNADQIFNKIFDSTNTAIKINCVVGCGATGTGAGTVTSVGFTLPNAFQVTGSPVTTEGTVVATWTSQNANLVFASPNTAAGQPIFRSLVDADLTPSYSGVGSCPSNQWVTGLSRNGAPTCIQPAFTSISGTIGSNQLPGATSSALGAIQLAGDLSNIAAAPKVTGIQGIPVSSTAPTNGQVHQFNSGLNQWVSATLPSPPTFQVNGTNTTSQATVNIQSGTNITVANPSAGNVTVSLSGTIPASSLPAPTSSTLGGVESLTCAAGQFLNQILTSGAPSCATPAGGSAPTFQVNGTNITNQSTVNFQSGSNITVTNPSAGNVSIALSGTIPSGMLPTATAGTAGAIQLTGDLGGTAAGPKVTWLQGYALSSTAPSTGQCLVYGVSSWAPGSCGSGTFTPAGDLSGSGASQTVIGIQGRSVAATTPSTNQVLTWNGSAWTPAAATGGFSEPLDVGASTATLTVCATATACNVRFGNHTYTLPSSATAVIGSGNAVKGTSYVYVGTSGQLDVGVPTGMAVTCTGCTVVNGVSAFPADAIPISTWTNNTTATAWDTGGGTDQRALLANKVVTASTGLVGTANGDGSTSLAVDTTSVPTYAGSPAAGDCVKWNTTTGQLADAGAACGAGSGSGTVTSVGLTMPTWLAVVGSPVTTSGTLTVTAAGSQTSHQVIGTGAGSSFGPITLASGDIPSTITSNTTGNAATATALASTPTGCGLNQFANAIAANGNLACAAALTANAGASHNFLTAVTAAGVFSSAQPAISDLTATFTSPLSLSGNTLSLTNSAGSGVTAALGTDTKYFTASGPAATYGDVIEGDSYGGLVDSGTLLSSLAPKASPAFTGSVTLPITGSTQCLHVSSSGVVSGTGSDCGSGGGGGVTSWNTRTGAVVPAIGDYTLDQIGGAAAAWSPSNAGNAWTLGWISAVTNTFANTTAATSTTAQSSPLLCLQGQVWTSSTQSDAWCWQDVVSNGANGATTLALAHTGPSTGAKAITIPSGASFGVASGMLALNPGGAVTVAGGSLEVANTVESTSATSSMQFIGGQNSIGTNTGNATITTGYITGGSSAVSTGSVNVVPGTNQSSSAASSAGNTNIGSGPSTAGGIQGIIQIYATYNLSGSIAPNTVVCPTTPSMTVATCGASPVNALGVAIGTTSATPIQVVFSGQVLVTSTNSATVGDVVCFSSATGGDVTDNGSTACSAGQQFGIVISTTQHGASATLPLVQIIRI